MPAGETMTLRLDDEDTPRARLGRHRARVSTREETREIHSHARAGPWDRGPGRADRGVPRWASGGGGGGDADDDDAREGESRGGKSRKSRAALTVTTTHDLGRGRRCVTQTWSDVEDGDDPRDARWDARWDAERRTGDEDEVGTTFHATVNAHTVTREVMVELGSAHEEFGGRCEVRQDATARVGAGRVSAKATSWSVGTPSRAYDAFRALHGEDDDDGSSVKTARERARERATTREASGKFRWTYDAEERASRAVVTARSKPPSKTSEPPEGAFDSIGRTLDVQFRATSDARKPMAARVTARASPSPDVRAKLVARGEMFPRSVALDVELAHARADAERGITRKTTLRASIPLGKCSAKLSRERADGCALFAVALARDECVADVRCRFLHRRLELRAGVKVPCALFAGGTPRRGKAERAPDAFVAVGFAA